MLTLEFRGISPVVLIRVNGLPVTACMRFWNCSVFIVVCVCVWFGLVYLVCAKSVILFIR